MRLEVGAVVTPRFTFWSWCSTWQLSGIHRLRGISHDPIGDICSSRRSRIGDSRPGRPEGSTCYGGRNLTAIACPERARSEAADGRISHLQCLQGYQAVASTSLWCVYPSGARAQVAFRVVARLDLTAMTATVHLDVACASLSVDLSTPTLALGLELFWSAGLGLAVCVLLIRRRE